MNADHPTCAAGLRRAVLPRHRSNRQRHSLSLALTVGIALLFVVWVGPNHGGVNAAPAAPTPDSVGGHALNAAALVTAPGTPSGGVAHRLAAVPLAPNRPAYLSGQPAWLAYDAADALFFVAVPPSSVEVVPGDFGYDPVVVATIPVGTGPFGVAYDNVTGDVFVTNSRSANVSVIGGTPLHVVATVAVGTGPMGVAFDPVTRDVYVANNGSNNVSIISDTRLAVVATVAVGTTPLGVAADPSSGDVFVANHGSSNLSVISGRTNSVAANVALPGGPYGVAIDDALHRAYVTDQAASDVSAISDTNYSVLANISVPCESGCFGLSLEGLAYDSGDGLLYVGGGRVTVVVIQPANDSFFSELNFDPAGVAYDPATGNICATNTANATFECAVFGHPAITGPFTVQFAETGLPPGTTWSASVDAAYGESNGSTIAFSVANGTFPYSVYSSSSPYTYRADPATGVVTIAGANVTVSVHFSTGTYLVNVVESGLPNGTPWLAGLGDWTSYSTNNTNWFNVSNGTYELALGATLNYTGRPLTSSVTVAGAALVVNVTYAGVAAPQYSVTFTESGLTPGTVWYVTLQGTNRSTAASSLTFSESDGSYGFEAAAPGYAARPTNGTLTVNGTAVTQAIGFTSTRLWQITFHETGLPSGTDWGALIGSEAQTSTSPDVTFARLNGTYGYLVLPVAGYVTSTPAPIVVNGSDQIVAVTFSPQLYPIVFVELGLPAGTNWSVTVTDNATGYNQTQSSTTSSVIFFLPNGTYAVSFALPSGYNATVSSTTITVAGRAATGATVSVHAPAATTPPGILPATGIPSLELALALAVVVLLVLLVVMVLRSRRPPTAGDRVAP